MDLIVDFGGLIVDFPSTRFIRSRPERLPNKEKRVTFANQASVRFIEYYSPEEKAALWLSQAEISYSKLRNKMILRALRDNGTTVAHFAKMNLDDTSAFLGLERYFSDATSHEILRRRGAVRKAVLSEQGRQRRAGKCDADKIAHAAMAESVTCRKRAHMIGLLHCDARKAVFKELFYSVERHSDSAEVRCISEGFGAVNADHVASHQNSNLA